MDDLFDAGPARADDPDDSTFSCPRCQQAATARFYGPCDQCRNQLRTLLAGEARDVEREAFVPAMHVTPNAVALKE